MSSKWSFSLHGTMCKVIHHVGVWREVEGTFQSVLLTCLLFTLFQKGPHIKSTSAHNFIPLTEYALEENQQLMSYGLVGALGIPIQ